MIMQSNETQLNYLDEIYVRSMIPHILQKGEVREDRTGTGTVSVFGSTLFLDINDSFPLLTIKKTHFKSIIEELLWFISGSTNVKDLQAKGVTIWDEWADPVTGELNEIYGKQWSRYEDVRVLSEEQYKKLSSDLRGHFEIVGSFYKKDPIVERDVLYYVVRREIDQLSKLVDSIRHNPTSRRHILNGWNVSTVDEASLPPCHVLYQFYVTNDGKLDCHMYQRSADVFLGLPFNVASTAALTYMLAQQTELEPGKLMFSYGDLHLYSNHMDAVDKLLNRVNEINNDTDYVKVELPKLKLNKAKDIRSYKYEDFELVGYEPHGHIPAPVAV